MADKSLPHNRPKNYNDLADIAATRAADGPFRRYPWEPRTDRTTQHRAKRARKLNRP